MLIYHATQKIIQNIIFYADSFFFISFFRNSSFIFIFKCLSENITKTNLTFPNCTFTSRYIINDFKHLLLLSSGDI